LRVWIVAANESKSLIDAFIETKMWLLEQRLSSMGHGGKERCMIGCEKRRVVVQDAADGWGFFESVRQEASHPVAVFTIIDQPLPDEDAFHTLQVE